MSERRNSGSCVDLSTRTMDAAQMQRQTKCARAMIQQLHAKCCVHLRQLSPTAGRTRCILKRASMSAPRESLMTPDENGGVVCAISSGP